MSIAEFYLYFSSSRQIDDDEVGKTLTKIPSNPFVCLSRSHQPFGTKRCTSLEDCGFKRQYSSTVEKPCHATRWIFHVISMSQFARDGVWSWCFVTGSDSSQKQISGGARFYLPSVPSPNFTVTHKHLGSCSDRLINHILTFDWIGETSHETERGRSCSLNLHVCVVFSSVHVTKACRCAGHVFFPNYQQPCMTQIPVSLLSLSLPLHTTTQSGSCRRQATYCTSSS